MLIDESLKTVSELITYVRTKLGEPKMATDLANSQIATCLNDAVQMYREYATNTGNLDRYMVLDLVVGQQNYILPSDVMQIGNSKPGTQTTSAWVLAQLSGAQASDVLSLKSFDMVSYHMLLQWIHVLKYVTRSPYRLLFNNNTKELHVIPAPTKIDKIFIEVFREEQLDNLLNERWIKDYTIALCKIVMGEFRSKFSSVPGFGGSVVLNGDSIKQEGFNEKKELEDDLIIYYKWSQPPLPVFRSVD